MKIIPLIMLMCFLASCDSRKSEPTPTEEVKTEEVKTEEPKVEDPKTEEEKPEVKSPIIEEEKPVQAIALKKGWFPEYNKIIIDAVNKNGSNLLKYNKSPEFWAKLFCGVASAESSYRPWETYWEKELGVSCLEAWKDKAKCEKFVSNWNGKQKYSSRKASIDARGWDRVTKTFYLSEGLLQLSYSDKNYYNCDFDFEGDKTKLDDDHTKTIFDPKKNLECGVVILNKLVGKKGTPYYDSGHYWAVLKPSNKRYSDFKTAMSKCGS